jgi:hypothetical protein
MGGAESMLVLRPEAAMLLLPPPLLLDEEEEDDVDEGDDVPSPAF